VNGTRFDARAYWESRLSAGFDPDGVGYIGLGVSFNRWMYRVRRRMFLRAISARLDPSTARVLDIGSGTGFYIDRWHELGVSSVTGSDLTAIAVRRLELRYPHDRVLRLDVGGSDLPDDRFTHISAMDVLYHVVDDAHYERAFSNLSRLLEPGGLLVFSENFIHADATSTEHQVSRRMDRIESIVAAAGLEQIMRRPLFFLMNAPVDSSSRLHVRWWNALARIVHGRELAGAIAGAALYPFELAAVRLLHEGPSTELMVCRKRS
jgi:SAM-dependent methyltransferase